MWLEVADLSSASHRSPSLRVAQGFAQVTGRKEMESDSVWQIAVLKFQAEATATDYMNGELVKCPGWEPFTAYWSAGVLHLLLKRQT